MTKKQLVVWFRGHVIFTFCNIDMPVFKMATEDANVSSDPFKTFSENCRLRYVKGIEIINDVYLHSTEHFSPKSCSALFNNFYNLMKVDEGYQKPKWSLPENTFRLMTRMSINQ